MNGSLSVQMILSMHSGCATAVAAGVWAAAEKGRVHWDAARYRGARTTLFDLNHGHPVAHIQHPHHYKHGARRQESLLLRWHRLVRGGGVEWQHGQWVARQALVGVRVEGEA